jgi:hypothetical protein
MTSVAPNPPAHFSRNKVRGEAAIKPIVRIGCLGITYACQPAPRYESNLAERIGDRVSIKKISKGKWAFQGTNPNRRRY